MSRTKRKGIIFIVVGIVIPVISYLFSTGYQPHLGLFKNLFEIKVMVGLSETSNLAIPWRFFIALGVILVFIGIRAMDMREENDAGHQD